MLNNFHSASGLWDIPSEQASMDDDLAFLQQQDFSFLDDLQVTARDGLDLWPTPPAPIMPHHSQVYRGSSVVQTWVPLPTENSGMERANLALASDNVQGLQQLRGGAESAPSPAVRKFGFALQATVRRATIQRVG
jgi:hypothetical protein